MTDRAPDAYRVDKPIIIINGPGAYERKTGAIVYVDGAGRTREFPSDRPTLRRLDLDDAVPLWLTDQPPEASDE